MTQAKSASPGKKAIDYAEGTLGVHEVWNEANQAKTDLDGTLTELSDLRDKRRDLESKIEMREMEIVSDERGTHPDMSQAQMDKHVKAAFAKDAALGALRQEHRDVQGSIDGCEMDREMHETTIKICCARMNELGGLLQYLAVAKLSNMGGANAPSAVTKGPWD